jgi:hypothetical protein
MQRREDLERALLKRGFKRDDPQPHECPACGQRGVIKYATLNAQIGGRSIEWCHACGVARSWRRPGGDEERREDPTFDLEKFLA